MLDLYLVNTALELIPGTLMKDSLVQKHIKKFKNAGKILDTSLHHSIMQDLPDAQKRGRPDILHHFLLDALGSIANYQQELRIFFSCPAGLFQVQPDMRCPRDFLRFKGLMYQLLNKSHIPPKPPYFIEKLPSSLSSYITDHYHPDLILKFTRQGLQIPFAPFLQSMIHKMKIKHLPLAVLVGGFQKGEFDPTIQSLPGKSISLSPHGYDSWVVINRILSIYELYLGFLD